MRSVYENLRDSGADGTLTTFYILSSDVFTLNILQEGLVTQSDLKFHGLDNALELKTIYGGQEMAEAKDYFRIIESKL